MPASTYPQPSTDDLGAPLRDTTFVVVDLETTGGSTDDEITEIGAVKVRGGEPLGEFHTLVRPNRPISPAAQALTGITPALVAEAPPQGQALESFARFASGAVFVAHNARFDLGFLCRGYAAAGLHWAQPTTIDTVTLARAILLPGEVPNRRLSTLARHFRCAVEPTHRALPDARATVEVFHRLLERVGNLAYTLADLVEFPRHAQHAKRAWVNDIPEAAGMYYFRNDAEVLLVGASTNLRRRVRSYFTAGKKRRGIDEMLRLATAVEAVVCATGLEARVRELRMIVSHRPRYNPGSESLWWLALPAAPYPRITIAREATLGPHFGPFHTRAAAEEAATALREAFFPAHGAVDDGSGIARAVTASWEGDTRPVLLAPRRRLRSLLAQERGDEIGEALARLRAYHSTALLFHRVRAVARCPEIVAAISSHRGWDINVIRYGRLAGATSAPSRHARAAAREACRTAETVMPPPPGQPAASFDEANCIASWLETPGVRLIAIRGQWSWPVHAGIAAETLPRLLLGDDDGETNTRA